MLSVVRSFPELPEVGVRTTPSSYYSSLVSKIAANFTEGFLPKKGNRDPDS
jgi:hypothetical protein